MSGETAAFISQLRSMGSLVKNSELLERIETSQIGNKCEFIGPYGSKPG